VLIYLERLKSLARVAKLERSVEDYFRQNLYVTPSGMWSQEYLKRAVNVVGQERILFSSDYPYQYRPGLFQTHVAGPEHGGSSESSSRACLAELPIFRWT
jgi:Amidohydrolase